MNIGQVNEKSQVVPLRLIAFPMMVYVNDGKREGGRFLVQEQQ